MFAIFSSKALSVHTLTLKVMGLFPGPETEGMIVQWRHRVMMIQFPECQPAGSSPYDGKLAGEHKQAIDAMAVVAITIMPSSLSDRAIWEILQRARGTGSSTGRGTMNTKSRGQRA